MNNIFIFEQFFFKQLCLWSSVTLQIYVMKIVSPPSSLLQYVETVNSLRNRVYPFLPCVSVFFICLTFVKQFIMDLFMQLLMVWITVNAVNRLGENIGNLSNKICGFSSSTIRFFYYLQRDLLKCVGICCCGGGFGVFQLPESSQNDNLPCSSPQTLLYHLNTVVSLQHS